MSCATPRAIIVISLIHFQKSIFNPIFVLLCASSNLRTNFKETLVKRKSDDDCECFCFSRDNIFHTETQVIVKDNKNIIDKSCLRL